MEVRMKKKSLILMILLALILLTIPAYSVIVNGGHVKQGKHVFRANDFGKLDVYPHTAKSPAGDYEQIYTVTNKKNAQKKICLAYVFDNKLAEARVYIEMDGIKKEQRTKCAGFNNMPNGSRKKKCVVIPINKTFTYWSSITPDFRTMTLNGEEIYYSKNGMTFGALETQRFKIEYIPHHTEDGKYDMWLWDTKSGDCKNAFFNAGDRHFKMFLDPWFSSNYSYRRLVNGSRFPTINLPYVINGSNGFNLSGGAEIAWGLWMNTTDEALYYNNYTDYTLSNDTSHLSIEIERGNSTDYNKENIWDTVEAIAIYHLDNSSGWVLNDSTSFHNNMSTNNFDGDKNTDGVIGGAINFDGVNDRLIAPDSPSFNNATKGPHTVMAWANVDVLDAAWNFITNKGGTTSLYLAKRNDEKWVFRCAATTLAGPAAIAGSWTHITGVFDGANMFIYINGSLYNSTAGGAAAAGVGDFQISGGGFNFDGKIDEVRVYNISLTADQVNATFQNMIGTQGFGMLGVQENTTFTNFTLNYPLNNTWVNTSSPVLNVTVAHAANVTFINATDNQTIGTDYNVGINGIANVTWSNLADGTYRWFINSTASGLSRVWTFGVDTVNPTISYNNNTITNGTYGQYWFLVNVTANDTNIQSVQLYINGTAEAFINNSGVLYWSNRTIGAGTYNLSACIVDLAGTSNCTTVRRIILNKQPEITLNNPANASTGLNTTVILNFTVVDAEGFNMTVWVFNASSVMRKFENVSNGTTINLTWANLTVFRQYYWHVVVADGTYNLTGPSWTFTTQNIGVVNCSTANVTRLVFYYQSERDNNDINASQNVFFNFSVHGVVWTTYNTSWALAPNHTLCVYPQTPYRLFSFQEYTAPDYSERDYMFWNATVGINPTENLTLYLLNDTYSSGIDISTVDFDGLAVDYAFVKFLRYYPETNSYKLVSMTQTDKNGEGYLYLEAYNAWYKVLIEKNGVVLATYDRMKISASALNFVADATGGETLFEKIDDFQAACTFTPATEWLSCTATDTSGLSSKFVLTAKRQTSVGLLPYASVNATGSSVSLSIKLNDTNNTGYAYSLSAVVHNPLRMSLLTGWISAQNQQIPFGKMGVLATTAIITTLGLVGATMGAAPLIILSLVGLGFSIAAQLLVMDNTFLTPVILGIIAIMAVWKRRGG